LNIANAQQTPAAIGRWRSSSSSICATSPMQIKENWPIARALPLPAMPAPAVAATAAIAGADQAEDRQKLNEAIGDKDFLTKNAVDLAKLVPAARKVFARSEGTMAALDELEKLMKKPAPAADSTEAKVRSQITNRLVTRARPGKR